VKETIASQLSGQIYNSFACDVVHCVPKLGGLSGYRLPSSKVTEYQVCSVITLELRADVSTEKVFECVCVLYWVTCQSSDRSEHVSILVLAASNHSTPEEGMEVDDSACYWLISNLNTISKIIERLALAQNQL